MLTRARIFAAGSLLSLAVSGCPVTDDYYIMAGATQDGKGGSTATGGTDGEPSGGSSVIPEGGTSQAGSAQGAASQGAQGGTGAQPGVGGSETGGTATGGSDVGGSGGETSLAGATGDGGEGGTPEKPCEPTTERCNGHDDDCDGGIDEFGVCPNGCSGFVLAEEPTVGYMYCMTARDFNRARDACNEQGMWLAWLESELENQGVAAKLAALTDAPEVLIGASDQGKEGDWFWYGAGGVQFWKGNQNGSSVSGRFSAWNTGTPDNLSNSEDCAILNPATARWSDRSCYTNYSYLCEDVAAP